jgi:hypothetical protein
MPKLFVFGLGRRPNRLADEKQKSHPIGGFIRSARWKFHDPKNSDSSNSLNLEEFLGWLMGLEPTTTGITILDSTN